MLYEPGLESRYRRSKCWYFCDYVGILKVVSHSKRNIDLAQMGFRHVQKICCPPKVVSSPNSQDLSWPCPGEPWSHCQVTSQIPDEGLYFISLQWILLPKKKKKVTSQMGGMIFIFVFCLFLTDGENSIAHRGKTPLQKIGGMISIF